MLFFFEFYPHGILNVAMEESVIERATSSIFQERWKIRGFPS